MSVDVLYLHVVIVSDSELLMCLDRGVHANTLQSPEVKHGDSG